MLSNTLAGRTICEAHRLRYPRKTRKKDGCSDEEKTIVRIPFDIQLVWPHDRNQGYIEYSHMHALCERLQLPFGSI